MLHGLAQRFSPLRVALFAGGVIFGVLAMHTITVCGDLSADHSMSAGGSHRSMIQGQQVHEMAPSVGQVASEHGGQHGPDSMCMAFMMCMGVIVGFGLWWLAMRSRTGRRGWIVSRQRMQQLMSVVTAARPPPSLAQFSISRC